MVISAQARRSRSSVATSLLVALLACAQDATAQNSSSNCDCYMVSGPQPGYFTHHYFIDFRKLHSSLPPNATANSSTPSAVSNDATKGDEPYTNDYFSSDTWTSFWSINNNTGLYKWQDDGTVNQVASPQNVWISPHGPDYKGDGDSSPNNTHLTLRTTRLADFQSVAEIDSKITSMQYLSLRARMRIIPQNDSLATQSVVDEGGVFGLFTYQSDTQESDLEILTRNDARSVHCSNQPDVDPKTGDEVQGATEEVQLPSKNRWTSWNDMRVDWFNGQSRWYANGIEIWNSTKNVPSSPSGVVLNLWSDGGPWSGNMTVGGVTLVGVEWIEVVYNVSKESVASGKCEVGCWIDGSQVVDAGTPALAFNSTGTQGAGSRVGAGVFGWCVSAVVLMGAVLTWF